MQADFALLQNSAINTVLFRNLNFFQEVFMPKQFSREVSQLLMALLAKDPRDRIGCRGRGYV